ncbi:MAG: response regulator [Clostridia bacterium]|nr:response regulator [Clostridia bacterium]
MTRWLIPALIFAGSALMVFNIIGFIAFARHLRRTKSWTRRSSMILSVPIALLVLFLLGYLAVGIFGKPDLIVAGILFGGSLFVLTMYLLLNRITRRILDGERMEVELKAAEESSRAKTAFLASVSHEMRTPMNVILGLDRMALEQPGVPRAVREHLEKIGRSAMELLGMINNILDLNEIESGRRIVRREPFRLRDITDPLDSLAFSLCGEKGLTCRTSVHEAVPSVYIGDAGLIREALIELIDNAVKYTDVPGVVSFSAETFPTGPDARMLRCSVKDTGIGISPEFLEQLFDLFAREDGGSTTRFGGSGLGLAAVKSRLDLVGGSVRVSSEKGVGSVFTVTLPLAAMAAEEGAMSTAGAPAKPGEAGAPGAAGKAGATAEVSLEGRRILVAEDVPENAEIVLDLLELEGAEGVHAENGRKALERFEASAPWTFDAVLMDLRMPVMDGLEAARRIRALERPDAGTVPIIALTANGFENDVRRTMDAGMNAHLLKPVDADLLYTTLRRLIAAGGKEKEEAEKA